MSAPVSPEDNTPPTVQARHFLSTLGLCARARRLIIGTSMVCEAMRKATPMQCVLEASDTSEATHQRLTSKCAYYGVPHVRLTHSTLTLGKAIGKSGPVAAVAVTDPAFYEALRPLLHTME